MKKVTAIIAAVLLAFIIALGDQIIKIGLSGDIKAFFGLEDDITIPEKPIIEEVPEELNLSYEERLDKGDYYFERGFLTLAVNEYVKASQLEPSRTEPYQKLADANMELMDYGKAKLNAEEILKKDPLNYQARYSLIQINIKQSQFQEALTLIDTLLAGEVTDPRLYYYKAILKIAFNEHDEGKELLQKSLENEGAYPELNQKAHKILSGYEEFEFAKAAEELYLSELLARAFNQIEEYEVAIFKLKEILRERPELRDSWIMLGFAYLNLEKYLFALTSFEHAYELDSSWAPTQYFLGITYAEIPRPEDAIIYLNFALENGFEPAILAKQKLADLYLETEQYQKSVDIYKEVLEFSNQDINAFVRPIWIYLDFLNQPQKALKLGELAVMTFPDDPMAYNLLGWSQVGTKNFIESEKNLKKAITMDETFSAAYYNLGKLYETMEEVDKALKVYQKAFELDTNGSIGNLAAKRYNSLLYID